MARSARHDESRRSNMLASAQTMRANRIRPATLAVSLRDLVRHNAILVDAAENGSLKAGAALPG